MRNGTREIYSIRPEEEPSDPWLTEVVLEFATIAGLFALLYGLFFLFQAIKDMPV